MRTHRFISWDKLFSYWVLLWFFVYVFASLFTEENRVCEFIYENTNPIFMFGLALLSSFKNLCHLLIHNPVSYLVLGHIVKALVLKLLPFIYLCYQKIKPLENLVFSFAYFVGYLIYLFFIGENVWTIYKDLTRAVVAGKSNTTLEWMTNAMMK